MVKCNAREVIQTSLTSRYVGGGPRGVGQWRCDVHQDFEGVLAYVTVFRSR